MSLRLSIDFRQDGRIVEIYVAIGTIFFVGCDARFVPFPPTNIAFMFCHARLSLSSSFSNVGVVGDVLAITVELVNQLTRRKFCLVFAA